MEVIINPLELASELADKAIKKRFNNDLSSIHKVLDNGDIMYTEEVQDTFNNIYEYYYSMIIKCSYDKKTIFEIKKAEQVE